MPRFEKLTGEFEIATGVAADPVIFRFARTVELERDFTLAEAAAPSLLPLMLRALVGWAGVRDGQGQPIAYSEGAFFERIPSARRVSVLREWTRRMRGEEGEVPGPESADHRREPASAFDASGEQPTLAPLVAEGGGAPDSAEAPAIPLPPEAERAPVVVEASGTPGAVFRPESDHPLASAPGPPELPVAPVVASSAEVTTETAEPAAGSGWNEPAAAPAARDDAPPDPGASAGAPNGLPGSESAYEPGVETLGLPAPRRTAGSQFPAVSPPGTGLSHSSRWPSHAPSDTPPTPEPVAPAAPDVGARMGDHAPARAVPLEALTRARTDSAPPQGDVSRPAEWTPDPDTGPAAAPGPPETVADPQPPATLRVPADATPPAEPSGARGLPTAVAPASPDAPDLTPRLGHVSFPVADDLAEPDLPLADPAFTDGVERIYHKLRRAELHEPLF